MNIHHYGVFGRNAFRVEGTPLTKSEVLKMVMKPDAEVCKYDGYVAISRCLASSRNGEPGCSGTLSTYTTLTVFLYDNPDLIHRDFYTINRASNHVVARRGRTCQWHDIDNTSFFHFK